MIDQLNILSHIWRVVFMSILLVAGLFALSFLLASISSVQAKNMNSSASSSLSNNPNVVTSSTVRAASGIGKSTGSAAVSINHSIQSVTSATIRSSKVIGHGAATGLVVTARGLGSGFIFAGHIAGRGLGFVFGIPGWVIRSVPHISVADSIIRPSDHAEVPIIDPNAPELKAALAALPPKQATAHPAVTPQNNSGPQWPIRGEITTEFGVVHWPYQPTHTGLDISDGRAPGVTPIKPFRPGRVMEAVHSSQGLGNHIVVDHGNGVTSVYGHLNSISIAVGQQVALDTTLGFEGTTGVSTGPHLHFEVRVNGQAANPHQFVSGQP